MERNDGIIFFVAGTIEEAGMNHSFLKARVRAQETAYTREQDKHAIKHIKDALDGTEEMVRAKERVNAVRFA